MANLECNLRGPPTPTAQTVWIGEGDEDLYTELWKLCAGPLVDVPRTGERVYYFPQGHMEQLQASTNQEVNQELSQQIPHFNLPTKILCRVVHIQLLAEQETDEVYARITLLPEPDQKEPTIPDPSPVESQRETFHSFSKILTPSDTSTHGGCSIRRMHATECLPPLPSPPSDADENSPPPSQELVAKDLHGFEWKFKHVLRGKGDKGGSPKRHLFTTGWSTFVTSKRLVAGDAFVFLRGEDGEMRVGIRRLARQQIPMPSSVISSQSMHLGVLATASHAVMTRTMFVVYYKPRSSQFIIGLNKYLEAVKNKFTAGMRYKMRFEVEESPERRFSGTIVGVGDVSPGWSNSQWRSLKVHWDEPATFPRPERVSAWEIEPFVVSTALAKRPRHADHTSSSEIASNTPASAFWFHGSSMSHDPAELGGAEVQCKENQVVWSLRQKETNGNPMNSHSSSSRVRMEGIWSNSPHASVPPNPPNNNAAAKQGLSPISSKPNDDGLTHDKVEVDARKKTENPTKIFLFGVNLTNNFRSNVSHPEKEQACSAIVPVGPKESTPITITASATQNAQNSNYSVSDKEQQNQISSDVLPAEKPNKLASLPSMRTRTKVQMQGVAVGRAVDLTMLNGYDELTIELEKLFHIEGELRSQNKWAVTFTDDENDMMLVGDDPWPEFCNIVKRIYIYSREDVKKMKYKLSVPSLDCEETLLSKEET
ncbi:auxin response factor 9 isoform X5 [Arachis ipaensis]|uniref:auxin response factor 9 isoform X5 n=1 Tax=Arachis ipaensis TaxID=130454 RepID=UPI0007AFE053|nr:auxin response factor 9 isoform X5 [Arachis ipaensis]XP_029149930.1 auxin response factor 9 isoform X3 [Arachis hypogaea]